MEVVCGEKESTVKGVVLNSIKFLIQDLKLTNSNYTLLVFFDRGMAKREEIRGSVAKIGPKMLCMMVDTALDLERLILTISHEMVHVKQFARGHVQTSKRGAIRYWHGKAVRKKYYDQPWELEAFGKERILANKIFRIINS